MISCWTLSPNETDHVLIRIIDTHALPSGDRSTSAPSGYKVPLAGNHAQQCLIANGICGCVQKVRSRYPTVHSDECACETRGRVGTFKYLEDFRNRSGRQCRGQIISIANGTTRLAKKSFGRTILESFPAIYKWTPVELENDWSEASTIIAQARALRRSHIRQK